MPEFMSEKFDQIFDALVQVQAELPLAPKAKTNSYFNSPYADLPGVIEASRAVLSKYGLFITQLGDGKNLVTILGHNSGQWIKSTVELPIEKAGPQAMGSSITYLRRYMYMAIIGMAADEEDDDGNKGQAAVRNMAPKQMQSKVQQHIGKTHSRAVEPIGIPEAAPMDTYAYESQQIPDHQISYTEEPLFDDHILSEEVCQVGKRYKGLTFSKIGKKDLASYVKYFEDQSHKDNKPLFGQTKDFVEKAKRYLEGR